MPLTSCCESRKDIYPSHGHEKRSAFSVRIPKNLGFMNKLNPLKSWKKYNKKHFSTLYSFCHLYKVESFAWSKTHCGNIRAFFHWNLLNWLENTYQLLRSNWTDFFPWTKFFWTYFCMKYFCISGQKIWPWPWNINLIVIFSMRNIGIGSRETLY